METKKLYDLIESYFNEKGDPSFERFLELNLNLLGISNEDEYGDVWKKFKTMADEKSVVLPKGRPAYRALNAGPSKKLKIGENAESSGNASTRTSINSEKSKSSESSSLSGLPYLKYGGDYSCEIKNDSKKWNIREDNKTLYITAKFMDFRSTSLDKAVAGEKVNVLQILPFNFIIFHSDNRLKSTSQFFGYDHWKVMDTSVQASYQMEYLPKEADGWFSEILQAIKKGNTLLDLKRISLTFLNEASKAANYDLSWKAADIIYILLPTIKFWATSARVEDTFIKCCLADLIDTIFCPFSAEDDLRYDWANRKLNNMPSGSCLIKPDYVITCTPVIKFDLDILAMEVKPPGKNKMSTDFIKLAFQLKNMVDSLVKFGVKEPVVCGLLVEGFDWYCYTMEIKHEATYLMVERSVFNLPRNKNDLALLGSAIESLTQLEVIMKETIEKIRNADSSQPSTELIRLSFCWAKERSKDSSS